MNRKGGNKKVRKKSNRGFTLIEMLIVIAIIAFLLIMFFPKGNSSIQKAENIKNGENLKNINSAVNMYAMENENQLPFSNNIDVNKISSNTEALIKKTIKQNVLGCDCTKRDQIYNDLKGNLGTIYFKTIDRNKLGNYLRGNFNDYFIITNTNNAIPNYKDEISGTVFPYNSSEKISLNFIKSYGGTNEDNFRDVLEEGDEYVIAGYSSSSDGDITANSGSPDVLFGKLSRSGEKKWIKTYGGNGTEYVLKMTKTVDGDYIIVGRTDSTSGNIVSSHGGVDALAIKVDKDGNIKWKKTYGGSGDDFFYWVEPTSDGNYILTGSTNSNNGDLTGNYGDQDFLLMKIDPNGNILWTKNYGGSLFDRFMEIKQLKNGDFIAVGKTKSSNNDLSSNNGTNDFAIARFTSSGNKIWIKNLGGYDEEVLNSIVENEDGTLTGFGYSDSYGNSTQMIVTKLDSNGNQLWIKKFGSTDTDYIARAIKVENNNYLTVGYSGDDVNGDIPSNKGITDFTIMKLDSNGNKLWVKSYGGTNVDFLNNLNITSEGDYLFVGNSSSGDYDIPANKGGSDAILMKTDKNGDFCN